jgi:hypothetical protein
MLELELAKPTPLLLQQYHRKKENTFHTASRDAANGYRFENQVEGP